MGPQGRIILPHTFGPGGRHTAQAQLYMQADVKAQIAVHDGIGTTLHELVERLNDAPELIDNSNYRRNAAALLRLMRDRGRYLPDYAGHVYRSTNSAKVAPHPMAGLARRGVRLRRWLRGQS